ncbi:uncharacterized protein LOC143288392 isoform X1 [Babylonia areolata]|uniref:uncharacterized protein LOC143288392 isoform X1 n=1 Tax=Babylonia areolata TaxID=304850 RepID=UPI003FCF8AC8
MESPAAESSPVLQPDLAWLSDSYRPRLQQQQQQQQQEQDNTITTTTTNKNIISQNNHHHHDHHHNVVIQADSTDSFVLCPKDQIESYAGYRLLKGNTSTTTTNTARRPHSAQGGPRQLGHVRISHSSNDDVPVEWNGWGAEVWAAEGVVEVEGGGGGRGKEDGGAGGGRGGGGGGFFDKGHKENVDRGHALWLAAKRKHSSTTSSSSSSTNAATRPSSARVGRSQPHPHHRHRPSARPSSAVGRRPYNNNNNNSNNNNSSSLPPRPSSAMGSLLHPSSTTTTTTTNNNNNPSTSSHHRPPPPRPSSPAMSLLHPDMAWMHPNNDNDNDTTTILHSTPPTRPPSPMTLQLLHPNNNDDDEDYSSTSFHPTTKPSPSPSSIMRRPRPFSAVQTRRELAQQQQQQQQQQKKTNRETTGHPPKTPRNNNIRTRPSSASAAVPSTTTTATRTSNRKLPPGRVDPFTVREKRLRALHEAWARDPRSGLHVIAGGLLSPSSVVVGPSPHLLDRHARCLDHRSWGPSPPPPPAYDLLSPERPHSSCGLMRTGGGGGSSSGGGGGGVGRKEEDDDDEDEDEDEEMLMLQQALQTERDGMCRVQRYIDCHRPASAPRMRKELEGSFRRSVGTRGRSPHFCNFVQKAGLHVRPDSAQARTGGGGSDAEEDGRNSLASSEATDNDILAQWRKGRLSNSGTEGRPGSPTSLDGRSRDPGVTSGSNMAGSEDEDVMSAKMIPTITIPSSPIPSGDQMMLSNRSSGESSPRKSAREEPKRPEESSEDRAPKPQHLAVSAPLPASPPKVETRAEKSKRPPVPKKTRKAGGDRRRKSKTVVVMEPVPVETSGSGEPAAATSGDAETRPKTNGVDVSIKVADLPEVSASAKKNGGKPGKRSQRRLIATPPAGGEKLQLPQELLDLDSSSRTGYDFGDLETTLSDSYNNKYRPQSWLSTRMALSKQASRFELPMDMKVLEKITPQDYLKRFCVVTSRRLNLYQKIFNKYKDKANNINKQGLETCLKETLVQQMKDTTFPDLCDLLDITQDTVIDFKLFSGAAAITERILYPHYTTEDTVEKAEYQRDKIETADFEALDWKLHGVKVGEKMTKLLKTIE